MLRAHWPRLSPWPRHRLGSPRPAKASSSNRRAPQSQLLKHSRLRRRSSPSPAPIGCSNNCRTRILLAPSGHRFRRCWPSASSSDTLDRSNQPERSSRRPREPMQGELEAVVVCFSYGGLLSWFSVKVEGGRAQYRIPVSYLLLQRAIGRCGEFFSSIGNRGSRNGNVAGARDASDASPAQEKCHLIEVMHYGGNLIRHDRFESNVVGSGNNLIGLSRVEAMNSKSCVAGK